jgi:ferredoxin
MTRLAVNPIACRGFGICGELFPERVRLDEWGYPIIDSRSVGIDLHEHAQRAVDECPAMALRLVEEGAQR